MNVYSEEKRDIFLVVLRLIEDIIQMRKIFQKHDSNLEYQPTLIS